MDLGGEISVPSKTGGKKAGLHFNEFNLMLSWAAIAIIFLPSAVWEMTGPIISYIMHDSSIQF